ncbi:hypothetical protein YTPLAS18_36030 [Nitrospira sp.]|nr:hypothetical protein YTPLAS18_36030 [Nitrospira sp.]
MSGGSAARICRASTAHREYSDPSTAQTIFMWAQAVPPFKSLRTWALREMALHHSCRYILP